MGRTLWWVASAAMLVIFLPLGILLLSITLLKEIGYMVNTDDVTPEPVEQEAYFENTLEKFR
jgi:hypothetical protein